MQGMRGFIEKLVGGGLGLTATLWLVGHLAGCPSPASSEAEVMTLVSALASPVAPPYENQSHEAGMECVGDGDYRLCRLVAIVEGFEHPRVKEASRALIGMGTRIFPILARYLDDERYSYSRVGAAWWNYTVGAKIVGILGDGIEFVGVEYVSRDHPGGHHGRPHFAEFLRETNPDSWARRASKSTKLQLRREYIAWVIAKEETYGFMDNDQQRWILDPFRQELARIDMALANGAP